MPSEADKLAAATLAASLLQIEAQASNFQVPITPVVAAKRYLACLEEIQEQERVIARRPVYVDHLDVADAAS